ncbi:MAG: antibiotic biosynthesis monooxygenase [Oscillospiraceae bacterium]|jgi:quinol monooxygenase YgiN|nr:antibiotic biosynthesis monooxygenase [Oscillospiraceae bacterium]
MLIVTGTYKIKPGMREEFLKKVIDQGIYAEFLKENGNLSYNYFFPYGNDDDVYFVEQWENMAAWDAHKAAPNTAKLQPLKDEYMTGFTPGIVGEIN